MGSWPRTDEPTKYTAATAKRPPAKAKPWMATTEKRQEDREHRAEPAPADTPRMSGETSGLRNMPW